MVVTLKSQASPKTPTPLPLIALALTAVAAGLVAADTSSTRQAFHPAGISSLYRHADAALDNGTLTANFDLALLPAPARHTLPRANPRPIVHQPYPPLAR